MVMGELATGLLLAPAFLLLMGELAIGLLLAPAFSLLMGDLVIGPFANREDHMMMGENSVGYHCAHGGMGLCALMQTLGVCLPISYQF